MGDARAFAAIFESSRDFSAGEKQRGQEEREGRVE
jgi:hypothetical protein